MDELLRKLSAANAVSGNEHEVRQIITDEIREYTDRIDIDSMGNILALKKGGLSGKRIAAAANMDEPGFILSGITEKGYIKFSPIGNVDPRKLVSKRVIINGKVRGVIGMKAIHLQTKTERENVTALSKLFIDIGAKSKAAAKKHVSIGDYITFDTEFLRIGDRVKGKALERSGACCALINALKQDYPFDFYACFTVQKEVGARGANIMAHRMNFDAVLSVSAVESEDMFGCEKNPEGAALGNGVAVVYADKASIADRILTEKLTALTAEKKIRTQRIAACNEIGDAGSFCTSSYGAVITNIAIPCRYSHSPVSVMSPADIEETEKFIGLYINEIGEMI